jgi:hypothetical protein
MYQRVSYWANLCEIWYWGDLRKSVEKIQVWLRSVKNNGYLTWNPKMAYCCRSHKFVIKAFFVQLLIYSIFILLAVTCSSIIHREPIVFSIATIVTRTTHDVRLQYIASLVSYVTKLVILALRSHVTTQKSKHFCLHNMKELQFPLML